MAQSQLIQQGDRYFQEMAFVRALDYYQSAYKKDSTNHEAKLKIAESYRKLNQPEKAEKWYALAIQEESSTSAEYYLYYAEALSSNGKYEEAKEWYEKYAQKQGKERRVLNRIKGIENQQALYRNEDYLTVSEAPFNSEQSDFAPAFFENSIVFTSARSGRGNFAWDNSSYLDLYKLNGENGKAEALSKEINTKYHEGTAVFFDNDTKVIFTRSHYHEKKLGRSKEGINKLKLLYAEKKENGKWTKPELLPFNSAEYSCGHPTMSSDNRLYFSSDMPGGFGGTDIYTTRMENGEWQEPKNMGKGINTEGNEMFPYLHNDAELYFASNGREGLGGLDIFGVDIKGDKSSHITNLGYPINTSSDDFALIVNSDGHSGYFSSNREGGKGNDDIYTFTSTKSLLDQWVVKGAITDAKDGRKLKGAKVILQGENNNVLASTYANEEGYYQFNIQPDTKYTVLAQQEDYREKLKSFEADITETSSEINLDLKRDLDFSLFGLITENNSSQPIPGVEIIIVDKSSNEEVLKVTTTKEGSFNHVLENSKINDRLSLEIQLSKKGYLNKTTDFETVLKQPGQINLHDVLNVKLDKIEIGTDIGELIDVQPIYFDLGKYNIRKDAAVELNKIVKVMKENPTIKIELGSHTDARGSASSNMRLSDNRAKASADYIVSQGISAVRIKGKGYGESQLKNRCKDGVKCPEGEHQINRRTEFKITKF